MAVVGLAGAFGVVSGGREARPRVVWPRRLMPGVKVTGVMLPGALLPGVLVSRGGARRHAGVRQDEAEQQNERREPGHGERIAHRTVYGDAVVFLELDGIRRPA